MSPMSPKYYPKQNTSAHLDHVIKGGDTKSYNDFLLETI